MKPETLEYLWKDKGRKQGEWCYLLDCTKEEYEIMDAWERYDIEIDKARLPDRMVIAKKITELIQEVPAEERKEMRLAYLFQELAKLELEVKETRKEMKEHEGREPFYTLWISIRDYVKEKTHKIWQIEREIKMLKNNCGQGIDELLPSDIEAARRYPLYQLLGVKRGERIPCQFHDGQSKNFSVMETGYCFRCNKKIDSIGWLMEKQGKSFREAVAALRGNHVLP